MYTHVHSHIHVHTHALTHTYTYMYVHMHIIILLQWQRPAKLDGVELVNQGAESEQKKIQLEREEKVLAQLFLSKAR